ncbi:MAG: hypothetical protein A2X94_14900 [Bdellovibrionales bacterium GWB1_55_8]|nr:MAG: hypothetical protein A2X94_14900 [Bdellovibrionales bacterium GWB1_55_8]
MACVTAILIGLALILLFQSRINTANGAAQGAAALNLLARSLYGEGLQMGQATRNVILDPSNSKAYANHEEAAQNFVRLSEQFQADATALRLYEKFSAEFEAMTSSFQKDLALQRELQASAKAGNSANVIARLNAEETPLWRECKNSILKIGEQADALAKTTEAGASSARRRLNFLLYALGAFMLVIPVIVTVTLNGVLKKVLTKLGEIVATVTHAAQVSEDLERTSEQLSSSAGEQAAAIQETVAAADEISAMVNQNADNSQRSLEFAQASQASAEAGKASASQVVSSIGQINDGINQVSKEVESSNQEISDIVKLITEIAAKTQVINDIVFQTKLLSFNASVEAARAGEHGKGFAVVAEEVAKLAEMSGEAAKEIEEMLGSSTEKVESIVRSTRGRVEEVVRKSKERGTQGSAIAEQSLAALQEIVKSVSSVNSRVQEISTASQEQANGIKEITKAVGQLDQVTQQNSHASQKAADAARIMREQASSIRESVDELLTLVGKVQG